MTDLEHLLPAALDRLGSSAEHAPGLAADVRQAARRRRLMLLGPIAAVVAVCAVVGVVWATMSGSAPKPVTGGVSTQQSACRPPQTGPLPMWARDGFSGDGAGVHWTLSASGDVAAIVFAYPLVSPPAVDRNNKILWVIDGDVPVVIPSSGPAGSAQPSQDLVITAHLEGTDVVTTIDTGAAPGPSIVDMPQPGCWHLDLAWGGRTDSIDLEWSPNR